MSAQSIREQSQYLWELRNRAKMRDGTDSEETYVRLGTEDLKRLERIAMRLERMAPHEDAIRKVVMAR